LTRSLFRFHEEFEPFPELLASFESAFLSTQIALSPHLILSHTLGAESGKAGTFEPWFLPFPLMGVSNEVNFPAWAVFHPRLHAGVIMIQHPFLAEGIQCVAVLETLFLGTKSVGSDVYPKIPSRPPFFPGFSPPSMRMIAV